MAKRVKTKSGMDFQSIKAAEAHFSILREATPPGEQFPDPAKSDLLDIYNRYCAATGWEAEAATGVTTEIDNRQRPQGTYAQTKAFAVIDASGKTLIFSIDKALAAIAE